MNPVQPDEPESSDVAPKEYRTPKPKRGGLVVEFLRGAAAVYVLVLLGFAVSGLVNAQVYPGLLGSELRQVLLAFVAMVVAPVTAVLVNRRRLWWRVVLYPDHLQIGPDGWWGQRVAKEQILLIQLGLEGDASPGTPTLPVTLDLPGLLSRRCRVWLSRNDARSCFRLLSAQCPRAIAIDAWGGERYPREGLLGGEALRRLGQHKVLRGLAGLVSLVLCCAPFFLPGLMFLWAALHGRPGAEGTGGLLLLFSVPGFLLLLGLVPSIRLLRQGRARLREAREWDTRDPVPERPTESPLALAPPRDPSDDA